MPGLILNLIHAQFPVSMNRVFIYIILLGFVINSNAQQVLNLEECRNLAIEHNKKLKIAEEEIRAAKARKAEAFTNYLPNIDGMGAYLRNQKELNLLSEDAHLPIFNFDPATGAYKPGIAMNGNAPIIGPDGNPVFQQFALLPKESMTVDIRNTAILQVGLIQPLYMGGKIKAYHQLAGLAEKLAESSYSQQTQQIILETDQAYWQIISLVNRQRMAVKYVETLKKLEHDVEVMQATGIATKADMLSVKVKLNEGEMAQTKIENGLSLSRMMLNQICGLPLDTIVPLKEESEEIAPAQTVKELQLEEIYKNRPEIESLTLMSDIYKKKERIARAGHLPKIALTANYLASTPSFFNGISSSFEGIWSVGVGIQTPIFHWGEARKNMRQVKAQTNIIYYRLEEAKEQIELQVNQSQFKIKEAYKKMEMADNNRERAEENLRFATLGLEAGVIPVSNVLEAQTAWLSAQSEWIDARIETKLCKVYLLQAYGTLGK